MKPYLVKTPGFVQWIFRKRTWFFPNTTDIIYLTFDDGPIPQVTPWVLSILEKYKAKATFFCIGDNCKKHTGILKQIIEEGHSIGNHTFNHLNGWKTNTSLYIKNVIKAEEVIGFLKNRSLLFRPPYGKLTTKQSKILQKKGYKIIMWDVLSADFDISVSEEKCLKNVIKNIRPGSIVVFHDSLKAEKKLRYTLPKVLEYVSDKGWKCEAIV